MRAYYGSRISENRTKTPEGYLICHNTPIARIGKQDYMPQELGLSQDGIVQVDRTEDEVFNPAAIASFEGKPVTDEHPSCDDVRPDNIGRYMRGVTTNVRRGKGDEADLLLADLIIYDPNLIVQIETGKREVSCGYNYTLEKTADGYKQAAIKGNHVAIVQSGRAGQRVRVKDRKPTYRGGKTMNKPDKNTIIGKLLSAFARDAEPEELAEASKIMQEKTNLTDEVTSTPKPEPTPKQTADTDPALLKILQSMSEALISLKEEIKVLKAAHDNESDPVQAMDELEQELTKDEAAEEAITITADEAETVTTVEQLPEETTQAADSRATVLLALKALRPVVAQLKDPTERKQAADAMTKAFRTQLQMQPTHNYSKLAHPAKQGKDSTENLQQLGRKWAEKWNPHYKNRK